MGCASSKQKRVCRNCKGPFFSPVRSNSMHVHHPPGWLGDNYHVVGVTSSTLGSIKLNDDDDDDEKQKLIGGKDFSMAVVEAKTWSDLLEKKIPKIIPRTPIRTPPGEPEPINAWELMEGLDDITPLRPVRSFSFHVESIDNIPARPDSVSPEPALAKPLWLEMAEKESNLNSNSNSNSNLTSIFMKSLEDLSPSNPFHLKSMDEEEVKQNSVDKDRVVLYFTSLRGVRKTYEDCCYVREILKSLGIRVDERDVSMHSGFKEELKELIGDQDFKGMITLPRVFVGKRQIGGAEEIRSMHEAGELEKEVQSCERVEGTGSDNNGGVCEACGDVRFVPCERCSGSCKIYSADEAENYQENEEKAEEDDKEEGDEKDYGFQRCPNCNENGLVRCPICCG